MNLFVTLVLIIETKKAAQKAALALLLRKIATECILQLKLQS